MARLLLTLLTLLEGHGGPAVLGRRSPVGSGSVKPCQSTDRQTDTATDRQADRGYRFGGLSSHCWTVSDHHWTHNLNMCTPFWEKFKQHGLISQILSRQQSEISLNKLIGFSRGGHAAHVRSAPAHNVTLLEASACARVLHTHSLSMPRFSHL